MIIIRKKIKDREKEISYLKGELANTNQLLSNFRNKNSTCFLQGDAFPRKSTEESDKNIDFAIDTLSQCLTIQLNSENYDEGDNLLKTHLDEQFKEIRKMSSSKASKYKANYNISNIIASIKVVTQNKNAN